MLTPDKPLSAEELEAARQQGDADLSGYVDGRMVPFRISSLVSEIDRLRAENERLKLAAGFCDKHQPTGGARTCLVCGCERLSHALSRIDYACGEPNDQGVSEYDVHCSEDAVLDRVKRLRAELAEAKDIIKLQREADDRAIKLWRVKHPDGRDYIPDRVGLVAFLVMQLAEREREVEGLKRDNEDSTRELIDLQVAELEARDSLLREMVGALEWYAHPAEKNQHLEIHDARVGFLSTWEDFTGRARAALDRAREVMGEEKK